MHMLGEIKSYFRQENIIFSQGIAPNVFLFMPIYRHIATASDLGNATESKQQNYVNIDHTLLLAERLVRSHCSI